MSTLNHDQTIEDLESLARDGWSDPVRGRAKIDLAEILSDADPERAEREVREGLRLLENEGESADRFDGMVLLGGIILQTEGRNGAEKALHLADDACRLHDSPTPLQQARADRLRGSARFRLFQVDEAFEADARAIEAAEMAGDEHLRDTIRLHSAMMSYMTGRAEQAHELLDRVTYDAAERGDREVLAGAIRCRGGARYYVGDYGHAISNYEEALEKHRELGNRRPLPGLLLDLASAYGQIGDDESDFRTQREALELFEEEGNRRGVAFALNNIGSLKIRIGEYRDALPSLTESLAIKRQLGVSRDMMTTLRNIGRVHLELEEYDRTAEAFEEAEEISRQVDDPVGRLHLLIDRSDLAIALTRFDEARACLDEAESIARERVRPRQTVEILINHNRIARLCDNPEKGREFLEEARAVIDDHDLDDLLPELYEHFADTLSELGEEEEAEQEREKGRRLEQEREQREAKEALHHALVLHDLERARARRALAEREAEILRLEKESLEREAELRRKELMTTAMFLSRKNETLQGIASELAAMLQQEHSPDIDRIRRHVVEAIDEETSWSLFERQFRELHTGYLEELARLCPDLTPAETKVCVLARAGLSIKETARIIGAEPSSVEKYRQRARKKLGIDRGTNLVTWLQRIGG